MAKTLIKYNGRAQEGMGGTFYVAAYSNAEAARLIMKAGGMEGISGVNEIQKYYSKGSWGNPMNGIEPTEPCVYWTHTYNEPPKKLI